MNNKSSFLELITVQATAGTPNRYEFGGEYLEIVEAVGDVSVLLEDRYGAQVGKINAAQAGTYLKDCEFSAITITSSTTQQVRFSYGVGEAGSRRSSGSVAISNTGGAFTQAAATVTTTSATLLAARTGRRYLMVQNKDQGGTIYINLTGAAATTANGIELPPGASLELNSYAPTAAITALGNIASNPNVLVVEG